MRDEAQAILNANKAAFSRPVDEILTDMETFRLLLIKWQKAQNLVSRETLSAFWTRHVADSLQLLAYLPSPISDILDLGSGGGFPAIPLAIVLKDKDTRFVLVEANSRKVAFLRAAARELSLNVTVEDARIEDIVSRETTKPQIITARALASLPDLLELAYPVWGPDTRAFFHKGRDHVEELAESHIRWHHDVVIRSSVLDESGVVLEIANLHPKSD